MKILAIDSSGMPASAAVCEDAVLLAEYTVNFKRTHSQTLVPMLDEIRGMLGLDLESIDAVAVAGGPGSFTGLRIGSAVAKGIGLAMNKPLIHVPTLEALACNYYGSPDLIVPMLDARNRQVFAGIYTFDSSLRASGLYDAETESLSDGMAGGLRAADGREGAGGVSCAADGRESADRVSCAADGRESAGGVSCVADGRESAGRVSCAVDCRESEDSGFCVLSGQEPVGVGSLCEKLNAMSEEMHKRVTLLGDGASAYRSLIEEMLTAPHVYAPAHMSQQRAGSVAVRGMELAMQGRLETAAMHRPEYLRVSQAERMRAQRSGAETVSSR